MEFPRVWGAGGGRNSVNLKKRYAATHKCYEGKAARSDTGGFSKEDFWGSDI